MAKLNESTPYEYHSGGGLGFYYPGTTENDLIPPPTPSSNLTPSLSTPLPPSPLSESFINEQPLEGEPEIYESSSQGEPENTEINEDHASQHDDPSDHEQSHNIYDTSMTPFEPPTYVG